MHRIQNNAWIQTLEAYTENNRAEQASQALGQCIDRHQHIDKNASEDNRITIVKWQERENRLREPVRIKPDSRSAGSSEPERGLLSGHLFEPALNPQSIRAGYSGGARIAAAGLQRAGLKHLFESNS